MYGDLARVKNRERRQEALNVIPLDLLLSQPPVLRPGFQRIKAQISVLVLAHRFAQRVSVAPHGELRV